MKDALVSFLTLGIVCFVLWALISVMNVFVSAAIGICLSSEQAWFCVGFATALTKPWDPILRFTGSVWSHLNNTVAR